jgi:hypothetical protein
MPCAGPAGTDRDSRLHPLPPQPERHQQNFLVWPCVREILAVTGRGPGIFDIVLLTSIGGALARAWRVSSRGCCSIQATDSGSI